MSVLFCLHIHVLSLDLRQQQGIPVKQLFSLSFVTAWTYFGEAMKIKENYVSKSFVSIASQMNQSIPVSALIENQISTRSFKSSWKNAGATVHAN